MNFYISDMHFCHTNVIFFDNRPFTNIKEMEEGLISNWNSVVGDNDEVYILGDFCFSRDYIKVGSILKRLNGKKILIRGNHDNKKVLSKLQFVDKNNNIGCFSGVYDYLEIEDNGHMVILSHYPIQTWNSLYRGTVHLYGHVHNTDEWNLTRKWHLDIESKYEKKLPMINVGCGCWYMNYRPQPLDSLLKFYDEDMKKFKENLLTK